MNFMDITLAKVLNGLAPIEHRRELDDDTVGLLQQQVTQGHDIRCAVADAIGTLPVVIATCRINIDKVNMWHLVQILHTVTTDHFGLQSKNVKIMTGDVAKMFLSLHVDRFLKALGHKREINTKAACEIHERPTPDPPYREGVITRTIVFIRRSISSPPYREGLGEGLLVVCCQLTGALLHGEMRGINNPVGSCPRGQFPTGCLTTSYLVEGKGQVNIRVLGTLKCQLPDIVIGMSTNEVGRCPRYPFHFLPFYVLCVLTHGEEVTTANGSTYLIEASLIGLHCQLHVLVGQCGDGAILVEAEELGGLTVLLQ